MIKGFKCCVCPYCGSAPSVIPLYDNRNLLVYEGQAVQSRQYGYRLECPSCGFHAPVSFGAVINKADFPQFRRRTERQEVFQRETALFITAPKETGAWKPQDGHSNRYPY